MARTDNISNFLTDVATAIKTKKGSQTPIQASNFDTEITNLPSGGVTLPRDICFGSNIASDIDMSFLTSVNFSGRTSFDSMFRDSTGIRTLPNVSEWTNGTSFERFAYNCTNLRTLPTINLPNATSCANMFNGCVNLVTVPNITALGNQGNGCSCYDMFYNCTKLENFGTISNTKIRDSSYMFTGCKALITAPNLDLSLSTSCSNIFGNCSALVNVPVYNIPLCTSNTSVQNMFNNCTQLSNQSLNNILATLLTSNLTNATYKTLKRVGLTSDQATTCTQLSNWTALSNAGWTTGY